MYYLIGIRKNCHPLGNDGKLITRYKTMKKRQELAKRFADMYKLDEVYGVTTYTQKMCEMTNSEFVDFIRKNGKRYV